MGTKHALFAIDRDESRAVIQADTATELFDEGSVTQDVILATERAVLVCGTADATAR